MNFGIIPHSVGTCFFIIIFLIVQIKPSFSYVRSTYEIKDLERNDESFTFDVNAWDHPALMGSYSYSGCNGYYLIGGYRVLKNTGRSTVGYHYLRRIYTDLPSHSRVYFSFQLWMIDRLEWDDQVQIKLDSVTFNGWSLSLPSLYLSNLCGNRYYGDLGYIQVTGSIPHTASSLTFSVVSITSQTTDQESIGFRDLTLNFAYSSYFSGNRMCANAPITLTFQQCTCQYGYYRLSTTSCSRCHNYCYTCFGPSENECYKCREGYSFNRVGCMPCSTGCATCNGTGSNQCTSCKSGYLLFENKTCVTRNSCTSPLVTSYYSTHCESPCKNATDFLDWNGYCRSSCKLPFISEYLLSTIKYCRNPCRYSNGYYYLYWDGSCSSICPFPLKRSYDNEYHADLCTVPCSNSSDFVYWNGSCISTCGPLFISKTLYNGAVKSCEFPCSSGYLYWNGSCNNSCPSPLRVKYEVGKYYCNKPCNSGEYLYLNQTCSPISCQNPYQLVNMLDVVPVCVSVCNGSTPYLYWDDTCRGSCVFPLSQLYQYGLLLCDYPCTDIQFLYWDGSCSSTCNFPLVTRIDGRAQFCDYPCNTNDFLCWNGSCISSCLYPLQSKYESSRKFCNLLCQNNTFLLWDGACASSCNFPLTNIVQDGAKLCEYPCLGGQYLYWNGTCATTCQSYYKQRVYATKNFCDPSCPTEQAFYVEQRTCVDTCPAGYFASNTTRLCEKCTVSLCSSCPKDSDRKCLSCFEGAILDTKDVCRKCEELKIDYVKRTKNGHQYKLQLLPKSCDLDQTVVLNSLNLSESSKSTFPKVSFNVIKRKNNIYQVDLILYDSIFETKTLEFTISHMNGTMKVPKGLTPDATLEKLAEYTPTAQTTLTSFMGASFGGTLAIGAAAALWSILSFQQFVGYFIFINVEYPFQVKLFLSLFQSISWDVLPNPLAKLTSRWSKNIQEVDDVEFNSFNPPKPFLDNDMATSFFIENGGTIFVLNVGLLLLLLLCILFGKISCFRGKWIIKIIINNLKWNIIVRTFLENGVPLALAVFLQLRTASFKKIYLGMCTVLAILSLSYIAFMTNFMIKVVKSRRQVDLEARNVKASYGTLYEGMNLNKRNGRYYHIIIFLRGIVLVFLLAFFENYPLLQSSILIYMNIYLIYFLFAKAAFLNLRLNIINRIKEVLILVGEICLMLLQFQFDSVEYYDLIGWMMVASLALALLIEVFYTIIIQIKELRSIPYKISRLLNPMISYFKKKGSKISTKDFLKLGEYLPSRIVMIIQFHLMIKEDTILEERSHRKKIQRIILALIGSDFYKHLLRFIKRNFK